MKKRIKKLVYLSGESFKSILSEFMEGFLYLLHISSSPLSTKFLGDLLKDYYYSQSALKMQLKRLHRRGLISPIKGKRFSFVSLNKRIDYIMGDFIDLKKKKYAEKWDKKWRILIYDIPEKYKIKREYFRNFLKNIGFGKVQDSCWVSPYDYSYEIKTFSQKEGILDYICLYEGSFYAGKNIDLLVEDIWSLNKLFEEYDSFIKSCQELRGKIIMEKIDFKGYYKFYSELYGFFKELLNKDPFLPKQFLRKDIRKKAEEELNSLGKEIIENLQITM